MSKTVDDRVVKLTLDNSAFDKNAESSAAAFENLKRALSIAAIKKNLKEASDSFVDFAKAGADSAKTMNIVVGDLWKKLVGNSQNTANDIQSSFTSIKLDKLIDGVESIKSKFSITSVLIRNEAIKIANALEREILGNLQKIGNYLSSGVINGGLKRAMDIENARFGLEGLLKDSQKVQNVLDRAKASVDGTAYAFNSAASAASMFMSTGLSMDELDTALRAVAGTAAQTNSDYDRIAHIFTTIAGQGRVMGEQLNQFASANVNVAVTLRDYLIKTGKVANATEADVRQLVTDGKISFATFAAAMDDAFGEHAKDANKTLTGSMANIRSALARTGESLFTPFIQQESSLVNLFNTIRSKVNSFNKVLTASGGIAEQFYNTFNPFIVEFNNALNGIDIAAVAKKIVPWVETIFKYISKLVPIASQVVIYVYKFVNATIDAVNQFSKMDGFVAIIRTIRNVLDGIKSIINPIKNAFLNVFTAPSLETIVGGIKQIEKLSSKLEISGANAYRLQVIFEGLFKVLSFIFQIVSELISPVSKLLGFLGRIGSFILKYTAKLVLAVQSSEKFRSAVDKLKTAFMEFLNDAPKATEKLIDKLKSFFKIITPVPDAGNKLTKAFEPLKGAVGKLSDGFVSLSTNALKGVNVLTIFKAVVLTILGELMLRLKGFTDFGKELSFSFTKFKDSLYGIMNRFKDILGEAKTYIKVRYIKDLAGAILILAISLSILASIPIQELVQGIIGLGAVVYIFKDFVKFMEDFINRIENLKSLDFGKISIMFTNFAASVLIISWAFSIIAHSIPDLDTFYRTLISITAIMGLLTYAIKTFIKLAEPGLLRIKNANVYLKSFAQTYKQIGKLLIKFAETILILAVALKILANTASKDPTAFLQSFAVIATSLLMVTYAIERFATVAEKHKKTLSFSWAEGLKTKSTGTDGIVSMLKALSIVMLSIAGSIAILSQVSEDPSSTLLLIGAFVTVLYVIENIAESMIKTIAKLSPEQINGFESLLLGIKRCALIIGGMAIAMSFSSGIMESVGALSLILWEIFALMAALVHIKMPRNIDDRLKVLKKTVEAIATVAVAFQFAKDVKAQSALAIGILLGVIYGLVLLVKKFKISNKDTEVFQKVAKAMITMSIAIGVLAFAIRILSGLDLWHIGMSLVVLIGGMTALIGGLWALSKIQKQFSQMMPQANVLGKLAQSMILMSVSLVIIAAAIRVIADLNIEQSGGALLVLAGALATLVLGIAGLSAINKNTNVAGLAFSMILMATSLVIMAEALKVAAGVPVETIITLGLALATLIVGLAALTFVGGGGKLLLTAMSLIAVAVALNIISQAVVALGQLQDPIKALLTFAAVIATVTVGLGLLGAVAVYIEPGIAVLMSFGLSLLPIAAAAFLFGAALALVTSSLNGLIAVDPTKFQSSLQALGETIMQVLDLLARVLVGIFTSTLHELAMQAPQMARDICTIVVAIIDALADMIQNNPDLLEKLGIIGKFIIEGILYGIKGFIMTIFQWFYDNVGIPIRDMIMSSMGIESPSKMMMPVGGYIVEGLLVGIKNGISTAWEAIKGFGKAIIDGFKNGLGFVGNKVVSIYEAGKNILTSIKNGLISKWNELKEYVLNIGRNLVNGIKDGIESAKGVAVKSSVKLATGMISVVKQQFGIKSPSKVFASIGGFLMSGLASGIADNSKPAITNMTEAAGKVDDAARDRLGVHSDSTVAKSIGGYVMSGLASGIKNAADEPELAMGGAMDGLINTATSKVPIFGKIGGLIKAGLSGDMTYEELMNLVDSGALVEDFEGIGPRLMKPLEEVADKAKETGDDIADDLMPNFDDFMPDLGEYTIPVVPEIDQPSLDTQMADMNMFADSSDIQSALGDSNAELSSIGKNTGITSDGISTIVSEIRTLDQDVVSAITGGTSTIGKSADIAASGVTSIDDSTKIQNEYTKDIAANSEEQTEDNKETKSAWKKVDLQPIEKNQRKILKASSNSRVEIERFIGKASDADDRKERIAIADQITDEVANASWIDDEEQRKKYLSERSDERTAYQLKDELRLADAAIDIQKTNKETAKQLEEQKKVDAFSKIENVVGKYIKENNLTKEEQSVLWTRVGNWLKKNNDLFYELSILRSNKATNEQIRNALMYFEENGINIANAYGKDDENYIKTAAALSNQLPNYLDAIYNGQVVANSLAEEQPKNTKSWIRQGVNKLVGAVTGIDSITFDKKYEEYLDKLGITTTRHLASIDNNLGKLPKYAAKEEETANENLETNKKTGNHIVKIRDWVYDQSLKNTDTQKFSKSLRYIYNNDNEWTKKYGYRDANNIVHTGSSGMYMSKEDSFLQLIKTGKEVTDTLKPLAGRTIEEVFKELQEQQVKNAVYNSDFKLFDPIAVVTGLGSALFQPLTSKIVDAATKSTDSKSTTVSATSAVVNMDKVSTVNTTSTGTANVATTSADISGKVMNSEEAKKTVSASGVDYSASINAIKTEVGDINTRLNDIYTRLEKTNVVMDTGELVGAIGPEMDAYLGNQMAMVGRGVS